MSDFESKKDSWLDAPDMQIVDGELLEVSTGDELRQFEDDDLTKVLAKKPAQKPAPKKQILKPKVQKTSSKTQIQYVFAPVIFLTVALFGGLRLEMPDNNFLFLKPALICLIFAAVLLVLFVRAGLIRLDGWFSEDFSMLDNMANGGVLITLFAATVQIFNSLLPETGLPFWIIAFCFFWTIIMNLFSEFDTKKLIKSLGALFGIAFLTKYLVLSYLTAPVSESFWKGILENPTQEFFTYLFDLPRFSGGTGYIQFFTVIFYLFGLFLLPPRLSEKN